MKHTYHHQFKDGTKAKLTLTDKGMQCEWDPKPNKALIPEYIEWRNECAESFTAATGFKLLIISV